MAESASSVQDYDLFYKVITEIGKHNFGTPVKEYPNFTAMKGIDTKLPPSKTLDNGSKAIRRYWNNKARSEGKRRAKN